MPQNLTKQNFKLKLLQNLKKVDGPPCFLGAHTYKASEALTQRGLTFIKKVGTSCAKGLIKTKADGTKTSMSWTLFSGNVQSCRLRYIQKL